MKIKTLATFAISMVLLARTGRARDLYVVQGSARGVSTADETTIWSTDAVFYNSTTTDRDVALLNLSNGGIADSTAPTVFTVAALRSRRLEDLVRWRPARDAILWVLHLNVPDGVAAESSLYVGSENVAGPPIAQPRRYGKVRLPIFDALVPAGHPQVHLDTNIGDIPARLNIAIYNAGDVSADADIKIYRRCDDSLIQERHFPVSADTIVQVGPFSTYVPCDEGDGTLYAVVTVDQPSFTFSSALTNLAIPTTSLSIN